jgi:hypothetical protein
VNVEVTGIRKCVHYIVSFEGILAIKTATEGERRDRTITGSVTVCRSLLQLHLLREHNFFRNAEY